MTYRLRVFKEISPGPETTGSHHLFHRLTFSKAIEDGYYNGEGRNTTTNSSLPGNYFLSLKNTKRGGGLSQCMRHLRK
jgi:hypothetical protein